jgi:hypothetical protein
LATAKIEMLEVTVQGYPGGALSVRQAGVGVNWVTEGTVSLRIAHRAP